MYIKHSNTLSHMQPRLAREQTKQKENQTNFKQGTEKLEPKTSNNQCSDTMLEHHFFQKLKLVGNGFNKIYQAFQHSSSRATPSCTWRDQTDREGDKYQIENSTEEQGDLNLRPPTTHSKCCNSYKWAMHRTLIHTFINSKWTFPAHVHQLFLVPQIQIWTISG